MLVYLISKEYRIEVIGIVILDPPGIHHHVRNLLANIDIVEAPFAVADKIETDFQWVFVSSGQPLELAFVCSVNIDCVALVTSGRPVTNKHMACPYL